MCYAIKVLEDTAQAETIVPGHSHVSGYLCKAIVARVNKFKKVIFGFVVADTKKGSKCLPFIITSVPESLQQDAQFLEPSYSFAQQITLSFEMQVSQSSSISKAVKMKSIVRGDISICCEEVEHNFTISGMSTYR
jgi:hypothetical protein